MERGDQAITEGPESVHDLRSTTTNDLAQAARSVADELAGDGSPTFRLIVEGAVRELHPILRDDVYRIAREALRNAFNHS
jgi:signal transduction histidine kinase